MTDKQLPGMLILASAGVILCAATVGWVESNRKPEEAVPGRPTISTKSPNLEPAEVAVTAAQLPQAALPPGTFPATARAVAVAQARASIVARDPMQPLTASGTMVRSNQAGGTRVVAGSRHLRGFVPPPPPEYDQAGRATQSAYTANRWENRAPFAEQLRLVGLIDNKAIFTVPGSVAADMNLARSTFILAAGDKIGGVTLESINPDSATVRDGKKISVKNLQPIR